MNQEPMNKGPSELLAKVAGLSFRSACVVLNRVLHGPLEGGLVLWLPVPEWFQPQDDQEVQKAARELPCHSRHGAEVLGPQDQP